MKNIRFLSLIFVALVLSLTAAAYEPVKGYRGFADANVDFSFGKNGYGDHTTTSYYGISTSHGYQFNSHFFLGAGVMYERVNKGSDFYQGQYPFFLQARTDWTIWQLPLYADVRLGGVVFGEYRLFFSPTVGYRLNLSSKTNLNFGLGMNFRGLGWSDTKTLHPQLAIRVGIDF